MKRSALLSLLFLAALHGVATGCGGDGGKPAESPEAAGPDITSVSSTIVVGECPDVKRMNAKAADSTVHKLVSACTKVPGGKVHFMATLQPGGSIKLASADNTSEGVVPICVLENQLKHRILLQKPCTLNVFLEEQKVGGAAPAAPEK